MIYVLYFSVQCEASCEYFSTASAKSGKIGRLATRGNLSLDDARRHRRLLNAQHVVSEHENVFVCVGVSLIYPKSVNLSYIPFSASLLLRLAGNSLSATFSLPVGPMLGSLLKTDRGGPPPVPPDCNLVPRMEVMGTERAFD